MKKLIIGVLFFVSAAFCFAQNNWLSLGGRLGGSLHFYKLGSDMYEGYANPDSHFSFNGAIQSTVNITGMFAVQTEVVFTGDKASVTDSDGYYTVTLSSESASMLIPFLAKVSFRPGNFVLSGIAGIYFTVPLGKMKINLTTSGYSSDSYSGDAEFEKAPLGFMIGASGGITLGPGNLFVDLRYALDFSETEISIANENLSIYKRSMFMFSVGYEIGLIGKGGGGGVSSGGGGGRRR